MWGHNWSATYARTRLMYIYPKSGRSTWRGSIEKNNYKKSPRRKHVDIIGVRHVCGQNGMTGCGRREFESVSLRERVSE